MVKLLSAILLISLSFITHSVYAEWVEASGKAPIINGDIESARRDAIEDAIKQAILFSGGKYENTQVLAQGLLVEEHSRLQTDGSVQALKLISEDYLDNWIHVTINADIFSQQRQCRAARFKKPLVITQTLIKHQDQAIIGNLFALGDKFSQQMQLSLRQLSEHVDVREYFSQPIQFDPNHLLFTSSEQKNIIQSIAAKADSQYVLTAIIHDLSLSEKQPENWRVWADTPTRNFIVEVFLLDGMSAEVLYRQSFHSNGQWPRDHRQNPDLNSQTFWQSSYGQAITKHLAVISAEIDAALKCEDARALIVAVDDQTVRFNLGTQNGLKLGDNVNVNYVKVTPDVLKIERRTSTKHRHNFIITAVDAHSAIATSNDPTLMDNVQVKDIVTLTDP